MKSGIQWGLKIAKVKKTYWNQIEGRAEGQFKKRRKKGTVERTPEQAFENISESLEASSALTKFSKQPNYKSNQTVEQKN